MSNNGYNDYPFDIDIHVVDGLIQVWAFDDEYYCGWVLAIELPEFEINGAILDDVRVRNCLNKLEWDWQFLADL